MGEKARVIALFSGKGGVGKSFLSLHLAQILARKGHRTLLVDVDLQMGGNLASQLQVEPIYDLTHVGIVGVHHVAIRVEENLDFVSAPYRLDRALQAQKQDLVPTITQLKATYSWVVLDLNNRFDFATMSALSTAHTVLLVTTPDFLAKSPTRTAAARLLSLGLERNRLHLIINQASNTKPRKLLGLNTYTIPYDRAAQFGRMKARISPKCRDHLMRIVNNLSIEVPRAPTRASETKARAGSHTSAQMAR